jgi:hypothetical protein
MKELQAGDYVLATKWQDGDPRDHWCIGFFRKKTEGRFMVVDGNGVNFRSNGFRRIQRITPERGKWILDHREEIEWSGRSVWYFARCSMVDKEPRKA